MYGCFHSIAVPSSYAKPSFCVCVCVRAHQQQQHVLIRAEVGKHVWPFTAFYFPNGLMDLQLPRPSNKEKKGNAISYKYYKSDYIIFTACTYLLIKMSSFYFKFYKGHISLHDLIVWKNPIKKTPLQRPSRFISHTP